MKYRLAIPHIPAVRKTIPNMEKKHEINNQIVEPVIQEINENKFGAGKNMGIGKDIVRNATPRTVTNP